jgi:hypothetical protein
VGDFAAGFVFVVDDDDVDCLSLADRRVVLAMVVWSDVVGR